jgi:hypothetical protein
MRKRKRERIKELYREIKKQFRCCPNPWRVAQLAFKNRGKVGYADYLTIDRRAYLAVASFVRHSCLGYDELLGNGISRCEARHLIGDEFRRIISFWKGESDFMEGEKDQ